MKKSGILSNLLLVFGLGVLIGILFAPRSGEKTRKMLAEKMEDTCGSTCTNLIDRVAMLKGRINEYMEELNEKVEDIN